MPLSKLQIQKREEARLRMENRNVPMGEALSRTYEIKERYGGTKGRCGSISTPKSLIGKFVKLTLLTGVEK